MTSKICAIIIGVLIVLPVLAAPDSAQSELAKLLKSGQAKLHDIEHLPVPDRGPALHEHMSLVAHAYAAAKALEPRAGRSSKDRLSWQMEHLREWSSGCWTTTIS
ncbi:MAG TPA: hypothetical protein VFA81_05265 [Burkholderiales bacterium]|nr:hypothetical protein [Burkholderiales bacterium]